MKNNTTNGNGTRKDNGVAIQRNGNMAKATVTIMGMQILNDVE